MEILCACDEGYVPHTATMLCSLLEHNAFVRVHLFHSSIGSRTLDKLIKFVVRYGGAITSYEMIADDFDYCQVDGWASIANYYRLVAPHFIGEDIDKILYLDSDLIVRQSLDKLWNTDVTDRPLAAVADLGETFRAEELGLPIGTKYFNSGVMLINLHFWRLHGVYDKLTSLIKHNNGKLKYWDQDALNMMFANDWIELPVLWNVQKNFQKNYWPHEPVIAHFCGDIKPWDNTEEYPCGPQHYPVAREYRHFRRKTPWPHYKPRTRTPFVRRAKYLLQHAAYLLLSDRTR